MCETCKYGITPNECLLCSKRTVLTVAKNRIVCSNSSCTKLYSFTLAFLSLRYIDDTSCCTSFDVGRSLLSNDVISRISYFIRRTFGESSPSTSTATGMSKFCRWASYILAASPLCGSPSTTIRAARVQKKVMKFSVTSRA